MCASVTAGRGLRGLVTSSLMVNLLAQHNIEVVRRAARESGNCIPHHTGPNKLAHTYSIHAGIRFDFLL